MLIDQMNAVRAVVFQVIWLHVAIGVQARSPSIGPTCDHLEVSSCKIHHSVDKNNQPDLRYYYEECFDKVCTEINPAKPPPPPPADFWLSRPRELQTEEAKLGPHSRPTSAFDFQNRTFAAFAPSVGQAKTVITAGRDAYVSDYMERYSDPEWIGVDSEGRFIRAESPQQYWFCSGGSKGTPGTPDVSTVNSENETYAGVEYNARVSTNTSRPLGLTEDMRAHCEFLRFKSFLLLTSCDRMTVDCRYDCLPTYRALMCALFFPQCEPYHGPYSEPGTRDIQTNTSGGVIYGPANITDDIGAKFIIIKPCRALCYEVERRCTAETQWQCDLKEGRDWSNAPYCNSVNQRDGKSMNP